MQLSVFELVKKGVSTTIDVVDAFAREQINQLNSSLNAKQNKTDNALTTTAKTIVGAINEINSDLNSSLNAKQNKTDNALTTTAKTIVGAINELDSGLTETNSDLAEFTAKNNWMIESNTDHADVHYISVTDVNSISNKPHLVHQISGSPLRNMPSDVGSAVFVGIRYVHYFDSNNIVVELKSMGAPFTTYYSRYNNTQHTWSSWYRSIPTVVS